MSFVEKTPPVSDKELFEYLSDLERRIFNAFRTGEFETINLTELNSAPGKLTDGLLFNADGTNYNPGSGKGVYFYDGSTFTKL